jgi:hypothetical protein
MTQESPGEPGRSRTAGKDVGPNRSTPPPTHVGLTTARRCDGSACWCRIGDGVSWPLDHFDEMARLARQIRVLEISRGLAS